MCRLTQSSRENRGNALALLAGPIWRDSDGSWARRIIDSIHDSVLLCGSTNPVAPCSTSSGLPPRFDARTGSPELIASRRTIEQFSGHWEGAARQVEAWYRPSSVSSLTLPSSSTPSGTEKDPGAGPTINNVGLGAGSFRYTSSKK